MKKITNKIYYFIGILFLILVIPAFGATMILGNKVNYPLNSKLQVLLPSFVMMLIGLLILMAAMLIISRDKKEVITKKQNIIWNTALFIYFFILIFVNIEICREIAFFLPYDVNTVKYTAKDVCAGVPLGGNVYYSIYPHNLSLVYILSQALKFVEMLPNYPYDQEFIWVQIGCVLFSIAGFFSCLIMKKISKNTYLIIGNIIVVTILVEASAWKMSAYTDTYGIPFAVISIYCYLCYRLSEKKGVKIIPLAISIISTILGGWIKPSLYVILLAIMAVEIFELVSEFKGKIVYLLFSFALIVALMAGTKQINNKLYEKLQFDLNPEITITWHHYFAMGLSDKNTGGYDDAYMTILVEHQNSQKDRIAAEMEAAKNSLSERGVIKSIDFYIRKMVKVFDDGVFSFTVGFVSSSMFEAYFDHISRNNGFTEFLRKIYWNGEYMGRYNTFVQIIWFTCLLSIPGLSLICFKKNERHLLILPVSFLGIFLYQMMFEARARYLLVFAPVIIPSALYGMYLYLVTIKNIFANKLIKE